MIGLSRRPKHPGVRVPSAKVVASHPLAEIPAPERVYLPLLQHIGMPGKPIVKRRDRVLIGDPLSESDHPMQVPVHASVSGTVQSVAEGVLPSGRLGTIVCIENDGLNEYRESAGSPSPENYSVEDIRRLVHEAGIVGLGGAMFPTSIKLTPKNDIDTLILNGCEGEPVLSADHRAMLEYTELMFYGIRAMQRALGAKRVIIALESHDPVAAEHLRKEAKGRAEIAVVPAVYPVSAETVLIEAVLDRKVPYGGLPAHVGVAVLNVETAIAVGFALRDGKPLTRRIMTVAGGGVERPGNYLIPMGTTVGHILQAVGQRDVRQVLLGGPMMGQPVANFDIPVNKGTSGVLALNEAEAKQHEPLPCVRCGQCIDACAAFLTPVKLAELIQDGQYDKAEDMGLRRCMECGSCAYVCPSNIPLVQYFKSGKSVLNSRRG